jgi:Spy/CpxP family protein refolding chaperone
MKNFTLAVLFCMLMVLGAFAYQGSMQQPAQTPQTPGAMGQNPQHPGATPPYAPPQSQPGTVQTPDAQTPQSEPSQAPAMHSSTPGVDDQVSALTAALNLTPDQQAKVKTILEDQHQQAVSVVNDSSLPRDAKVQKIHELRQGTIAKVRTILTSDEQKNKFNSMVQEKNDRVRQSEQPQPQNNTPTPK